MIGRNFFVEIGPCTNNYLIAQRYQDSASEGVSLDEQLDYVFTYRMAPTPVRLRLLARRGSPRHIWWCSCDEQTLAGPDPLAEAPERVLAPEHQELLYLRQFFYQCPAGLFETDDTGIVRMVNPAAVRLLAPIIGDGDLSQLFPLLRRVAPEMVDVITRDPGQLGPLAAGRRMLIPASADRDAWLEMQAVRVAPDGVMIVVQDVSAERRLAIREHQTAVELQLTMLGHADDIPAWPRA